MGAPQLDAHLSLTGQTSQSDAVKTRTIWLVVGFAALSGWAIAHLRDGVHLVLFACAMGWSAT
jgi:hypothetical protein